MAQERVNGQPAGVKPYGGWLDKDYLLTPLIFEGSYRESLNIPSGLEIIACFFDEHGLTMTFTDAWLPQVAWFVSHASLKNRSAREKVIAAGFRPPYQKRTITLEWALRQYDQTTIHYVDPAKGLASPQREDRSSDALKPECCSTVPLYPAVDYVLTTIANLKREKFSDLSPTMEQQLGNLLVKLSIKPFILARGKLFYTEPQVKQVREEMIQYALEQGIIKQTPSSL